MIHDCVCARWNKLNVPLHALAYILMPKYYSPSWLGQPAPGGGVRIKPHTYLEVQEGYMKALDKLVQALDKLVPDREECARLRLELGKYFSCTANFGSFHAMENRDRFDALTCWEAYGDMGLLPKLAKKIISQVVMIQVDIGGHPPIPFGPTPSILTSFHFQHNLLFLVGCRFLKFRSCLEILMSHVDIGGHPHIPFEPPPSVLLFFKFQNNLLFLVIFRVLKFQSHFEALNNVFWEK